MSDGDEALPADHEPTQDAAARGVAMQVEQVRQRLVEERPWSLAELAGRADLDIAVVRRLFIAANRHRVADGPGSGTEDGARYGQRDLDYLTTARPLLERFPIEVVERQARVRARALSSLVVADLRSAQLETTLHAAIEDGTDPDELGTLFADVAEVLVPASAQIIAADYRDQLVRLLDSEVVEAASRDLGEEVDLAVGFVDLVGFTKLSASTDPGGVNDVLDAFEDMVETAAREVGGVMPTKTLGDAVLLVGGDPDALARVLWHAVSVDDVEALQGVARRAGLAHGPVQVRDGDYVGTVVNTAARLTDLAHPGSLVITHDVWDQLPDEGWDTSLLPPKRLKGLGTARPLRLRREPD